MSGADNLPMLSVVERMNAIISAKALPESAPDGDK